MKCAALPRQHQGSVPAPAEGKGLPRSKKLPGESKSLCSARSPTSLARNHMSPSTGHSRAGGNLGRAQDATQCSFAAPGRLGRQLQVRKLRTHWALASRSSPPVPLSKRSLRHGRTGSRTPGTAICQPCDRKFASFSHLGPDTLTHPIRVVESGRAEELMCSKSAGRGCGKWAAGVGSEGREDRPTAGTRASALPCLKPTSGCLCFAFPGSSYERSPNEDSEPSHAGGP